VDVGTRAMGVTGPHATSKVMIIKRKRNFFVISQNECHNHQSICTKNCQKFGFQWDATQSLPQFMKVYSIINPPHPSLRGGFRCDSTEIPTKQSPTSVASPCRDGDCFDCSAVSQ